MITNLFLKWGIILPMPFWLLVIIIVGGLIVLMIILPMVISKLRKR